MDFHGFRIGDNFTHDYWRGAVFKVLEATQDGVKASCILDPNGCFGLGADGTMYMWEEMNHVLDPVQAEPKRKINQGDKIRTRWGAKVGYVGKPFAYDGSFYVFSDRSVALSKVSPQDDIACISSGSQNDELLEVYTPPPANQAVWFDGTGRALYPSEMDEYHLQNAISFCKERIAKYNQVKDAGKQKAVSKKIADAQDYIDAFEKELVRRKPPEPLFDVWGNAKSNAPGSGWIRLARSVNKAQVEAIVVREEKFLDCVTRPAGKF